MGMLTDLPIELWAVITSYLTVADKANLTSVNTTVQRVAESFLYRNICFDYAGTWAKGYAPPLHLLLRTVLDQPRLVNYVELLQIEQFNDRTLWWTSSSGESKPDDQFLQGTIEFVRVSKLATTCKRAAERVESDKPVDNEPWLKDLCDGNIYLYQALLVSLLPNLKVLQIGVRPHMSFDYVGASLLFALSSTKPHSVLPGYSQLQIFEYGATIYCREFSSPYVPLEHSATDILPFFYLPCIEEIRAFFPGDDFVWPGLPPCADTLRILRLHRSYVKLELLAQILAASPNLVELEYDLVYPVGLGDNRVHVFSCHLLDLALALVRKTLKILRVALQFCSGSTDCYDFPPLYNIEGQLNSLTSFAKLIEVEVPFHLLLGSNPHGVNPINRALPATVRSLILRDDLAAYTMYDWRSNRVLKCLPEHLQLWTNENFSLESIGLNIEESQDDWDDRRIQKFRSLCQDSSIRPLIHRKPGAAFFEIPSAPGPLFASREFV